MRKIAIFMIILSPFLAAAQDRDTAQVEIGGIRALAYAKNISTTFIMFEEKVQKFRSDTAVIDSGSVRIVLRPEYVTDEPRVFGLTYFEHVDEMLWKSFIMARGLEPNSVYQFRLVLTVGGKTAEKIFNISTTKAGN